MSAKDIREESDYNEFYIVSKEDTEELLNQAADFLAEIERVLMGKDEK